MEEANDDADFEYPDDAFSGKDEEDGQVCLLQDGEGESVVGMDDVDLDAPLGGTPMSTSGHSSVGVGGVGGGESGEGGDGGEGGGGVGGDAGDAGGHVEGAPSATATAEFAFPIRKRRRQFSGHGEEDVDAVMGEQQHALVDETLPVVSQTNFGFASQERDDGGGGGGGGGGGDGGGGENGFACMLDEEDEE